MPKREYWKENPIPLKEDNKSIEDQIQELDQIFGEIEKKLQNNYYENNRTTRDMQKLLLKP